MGSNCIDNLNYTEKDKVQSPTDSVILWEASCGYYATTVQSLVDLASGFEDSVQKEPEADQTVTGDFKLIFDGLSFASSIAPNELSIKSKANGGLDITADTNGLTTVKAKGVPVQSYDENGVNMLEKLKMPLSYASVDVNDVVVKSELTAVADDVTAVEQEVDAIQANYAKTDEENTFQEKQTLEDGADVTGLIDNADSNIKHNNSSFEANGASNTGMPTEWTCVKTSVTDSQGTGDRFTVTHNKGLLYPTLSVRTSVGKFASVTANANNEFSVDVWIPTSGGYERSLANCYISVSY